MTKSYSEFLESKRHSSNNYGIEPNFMLDGAFDFQQHVIKYAVKKGRCAGFLDTGLGKTLIELVVAQNYVQATNKPTLIITPLAVAFQFIKEAEKFGIGDIEYCKDGKFKKKIVVLKQNKQRHYSIN